MRVLVCGDRWDDLTAPEVTEAITAGWRDRQPAAEVVGLPFSSGGRGFVAALAASLRLEVDPTDPASLQDGDTRYLDGAALTAGADSGAVGMAIAAALNGGARRIVVGVGGVADVDGGAGLLRALGDSDDLDVALPRAVARTRDVELVAAYEGDTPLLGLKGASATAVETLGWTKQRAQDHERRIGEFADHVRRLRPGRTDLLTGKVHRLDLDPGSGAGGGAGFALGVLGARLVPGADAFAAIVRLDRRAADAGLVVAATQIFDWRSLDYDTVATVVRAAVAAPTPVIVLARDVEVGRRETMSLGASAAYPLIDPHSLRRTGHTDTPSALTALAHRLAGTWSAT